MRALKSLCLSALVLCCIKTTLFAQGFTPPADSNAVVYFVRVAGTFGAAVSFEFFHNEKFIGIFKGKNYFRYECSPGEQLLWASSENKEFLKCSFTPGETYVVLVNVEMGAWKAKVGLEPITIENEDFERVKELVIKQKPISTPESLIHSTQKKLDDRGLIAKTLKSYEDEWKNASNTKTISADMFIPSEKLN